MLLPALAGPHHHGDGVEVVVPALPRLPLDQDVGAVVGREVILLVHAGGVAPVAVKVPPPAQARPVRALETWEGGEKYVKSITIGSISTRTKKNVKC